MTTRFTILLAGDLTITERLKRQVAGTRVIAADGGMIHADALELTPELWLGDFDSSDQELMSRYNDVPRQEYPIDKDATDGELAIDQALSLGATDLLLAGGLGGQADHAFAHLMLLMRLKARGVSVMLSSGHEEAWPLDDGSVHIDAPAGSRISILPISDLEAVSIEGVRWPLERKDVMLGSTLTLSNEVERSPVRVSLVSGKAIVLVYPT
ncbi:MAG: thiamine diphosphokinase [Anderseniella sp.]